MIINYILYVTVTNVCAMLVFARFCKGLDIHRHGHSLVSVGWSFFARLGNPKSRKSFRMGSCVISSYKCFRVRSYKMRYCDSFRMRRSGKKVGGGA